MAGASGDRRATALAAAEALGAPAPALHALVGFDGFVDRIVRLVAVRRSMAPGDYEAIRTIPEFARRCADAAGRSTNIEQVLVEERFGGNGPLMAGALAGLGVATAFVGAIASDAGATAIHPVFESFARGCEAAAVCPPSWTLCMEFDDGKIMLNDTRAVQGVSWEAIVRTVGRERLRELVGRASLVAIVNWSLLGGVEGIWRGLAREVLPGLAGERRVFIDLSDPAKRTREHVLAMLGGLRELEAVRGVSVTLGLNLAEAQRVGREVGVAFDDASRPGEGLAGRVAELREALGLSCVVVHPRDGAAAADGEGRAWFEGPFVRAPRLSTGAGDHFNAGFALAQARGLELDQCLAVACATSGVYVREAASPTLARLLDFLRDLPGPEPA